MTGEADPEVENGRVVATGQFALGNRWEALRKSKGRPRIYETPEQLETACMAYFEWNEANPLQSEKAFSSEGKVLYAQVRQMRAMTIEGLCLHIGCSKKVWQLWRETRSDLADAIEWVEAVIRTQKLEGAMAGMLNPMIVARMEGLVEKQAVDHGGKVEVTDPERHDIEVAKKVAFILETGARRIRERQADDAEIIDDGAGSSK